MVMSCAENIVRRVEERLRGMEAEIVGGYDIARHVVGDAVFDNFAVAADFGKRRGVDFGSLSGRGAFGRLISAVNRAHEVFAGQEKYLLAAEGHIGHLRAHGYTRIALLAGERVEAHGAFHGEQKNRTAACLS